MHYIIKKFYANGTETRVQNLARALEIVQSSTQKSSARSYTELWKMENETDGSLDGIFNEDGARLVEQNPIIASRIAKARLIRQ